MDVLSVYYKIKMYAMNERYVIQNVTGTSECRNSVINGTKKTVGYNGA